MLQFYTIACSSVANGFLPYDKLDMCVLPVPPNGPYQRGRERHFLLMRGSLRGLRCMRLLDADQRDYSHLSGFRTHFESLLGTVETHIKFHEEVYLPKYHRNITRLSPGKCQPDRVKFSNLCRNNQRAGLILC